MLVIYLLTMYHKAATIPAQVSPQVHDNGVLKLLCCDVRGQTWRFQNRLDEYPYI